MNFTKTLLTATIIGFAFLITANISTGNIYATSDEIEELQDSVKDIQKTLNTIVITLNDTAAGPGQYQCTPVVVPPTPNETTTVTPTPCQPQAAEEPAPPPTIIVEPNNVTEQPSPCAPAVVVEPEPEPQQPPCPYAQQQNNVTEPEQQPTTSIPFIPTFNITEPTTTVTPTPTPTPCPQQNNVTEPETPPPSPPPQIAYNVECHCYVVENSGANVTEQTNK